MRRYGWFLFFIGLTALQMYNVIHDFQPGKFHWFLIVDIPLLALVGYRLKQEIDNL